MGALTRNPGGAERHSRVDIHAHAGSTIVDAGPTFVRPLRIE